MRRMLDDEQFAEQLRADLESTRADGHAYDTLGKLPELRSAMQNPPPGVEAALSEALPGAGSGLPLATLPLAGKVAIALSVSAVAWFTLSPLAPPITGPTAPQPAPTAVEDAPTVPQPAPEEATAPPPSAGVTPRQEIAELVRIRALLPDEPQLAYELATASEARFPNGILAEERRALLILAADGAGKGAEARSMAVDYLARYPESPLRSHVAAVLESP